MFGGGTTPGEKFTKREKGTHSKVSTNISNNHNVDVELQFVELPGRHRRPARAAACGRALGRSLRQEGADRQGARPRRSSRRDLLPPRIVYTAGGGRSPRRWRSCSMTQSALLRLVWPPGRPLNAPTNSMPVSHDSWL